MSRPFLPRAARLILFGWTLVAVAQPPPGAAEKAAPPGPETPGAATPAETAPGTPTPLAAATPPARPAATPAGDATAATPPPAVPSAAAGPNAPDDKSDLRRIDDVEPPREEPQERPGRRSSRNGGNEFPFGDHRVSPGSRMQEVFSIFGSATVEGRIDSDAVSVLGRTFIGRDAKVGGAAVAVLGRLESQGDIGDDAISVLGSSTIDGRVGGDAVSVLGNLHLGPHTVIEGDMVIVGGRLTKDPAAIVHGTEVRVPMLGSFGEVGWLTSWLKRCVFLGRPLAFGEDVGWAWATALSFFAFYLLLALLFPRGVVKCAETLETRPGFSVLASALTFLLTPVALVLIAVTIVGALLVPFLATGLVFAHLFGKAVMLAWIGRRFTRSFGDGVLGHPVFAVLIGGVLVLVFYTVPIVGFLTFLLLTWLGVGVVVYTLVLSIRRGRPAAVGPGAAVAGGPFVPPVPYPPVTPVTTGAQTAPFAERNTPYPAPASVGTSAARVAPTTTPAPAMPVSAMGVAAAATSAGPTTSAGFSGSQAVPGETSGGWTPRAAAVPPLMGEAASFPPPSEPVPPPMASASAIPPPAFTRFETPLAGTTGIPAAVVWERAGFFIRLGALALDGVLIGLVMAFVSGILPRALRFHDGPGGWFIALALYGALMWKHKGTTIGGIVCGLKVVRVDNRELDWATAIVRALACFLSLAVAGLGFIWVAIDDEKQSWHDKIAGTTVVRVPKGVSLL